MGLVLWGDVLEPGRFGGENHSVGESVGCEHASELAKTTVSVFAFIQVPVDHFDIVLE
jgi:hypothetical protein